MKKLTPKIHAPRERRETEPLSQAERVLRKFGGPMRLVAILKQIGSPLAPCTIYKWTYPQARGGTNGLIPTRAWPFILKAARAEGIFISSEDIDPRTFPVSWQDGRTVVK